MSAVQLNPSNVEAESFLKRPRYERNTCLDANKYIRVNVSCSPRVGAVGGARWAHRVLSPRPPRPLRTTCCSPVRCVRRDLLWPPLLPGFSSLLEILRSSSAQHTHPLYTNGRAAHACKRTHTRRQTVYAHALSIDRGSFKRA